MTFRKVDVRLSPADAALIHSLRQAMTSPLLDPPDTIDVVRAGLRVLNERVGAPEARA